MPANKNAVTRYYLLDQLLANRYHNYSTPDLLELINEQLGEMGCETVSKRTLEYDIHYLEYEGPFMVEIDRYQIDVVSKKNPNKTVKKNCLRYADSSFSIFTKKMTEDEKYLLREVFSLLGQFEGLPNLNGLEQLRSSLNVKSSRQIISFTKNPLENSSLLGELFTAISQQQVVEIHYHIFSAPDDVRQVVLHPYLLKEYNQRWYLFAAAADTGKLLNFSLDRIDKVVPLPSLHYIPCNRELRERFEDIVGVTLYDDRPLQTIFFWVSDISKDFVKTKPIHESQCHYRGEKEKELRKRYPMFDGGYFFSIDCIENYELIRELTSFGKELIVLSPEDVRSHVVQRVEEMGKAYHLF